jgi:hypothetical protein
MRTPLPLSMLIISVCSTLSSNAQSQSSQTTTVGPWEIATSYKADKFDACVMNRSAAGFEISFMRAQDGLLLLLDSPKWKLDRGKAYTVRLVAGSQSVEAKALAETRGVTVALADRPFNGKLRTATVLDVRGEGATLQVPLDGSAAAFERLEACFEKNSRERAETNPLPGLELTANFLSEINFELNSKPNNKEYKDTLDENGLYLAPDKMRIMIDERLQTADAKTRLDLFHILNRLVLHSDLLYTAKFEHRLIDAQRYSF